MKITIAITLVLTIHTSGSCQTIFTDKTLKSGIYKDFSEFISNSPSIPLNDTEIFIEEKEQVLINGVGGFIFYEGREIKLQTYTLLEKGNKKKIETKSYWGFSDGVNAYINSYTHIRKHYFVKILLIGRYCYFLQVGDITNHARSGVDYFKEQIISNLYWDVAEYIINVNNGIIYKLDKNLLKKILQKDEVLSSEFEGDKDIKRKLLVDYITKYNKSHMNEIKVLKE